MTKNFKLVTVSKDRLDSLAGDALVTEGMYDGDRDIVYLVPGASELAKYHEIGHALRNPRPVPSTINELLDDEILATREGLEFWGRKDLDNFELYSKNITQAIEESIELGKGTRWIYNVITSKLEEYGIKLSRSDRSRIKSYILSLREVK